ncbi:MAG: TIGR02221 family CRISPR-associated protein [Gammaproteobacteria bacterium]|nr:TIGR02221 family CRISPR-associated protein [Gammaproteobacteria bacterium]
MSVLFTFLGRPPRGDRSYQRVEYTFSDGRKTRPVHFLGWELQSITRPARVVVLGTQGSAWDHLLESDIRLGDDGEAERLAVIEAVERSAVSQSMLDRLAPLLSDELGRDVRLLIVPYCRTLTEQAALLRHFADHVDEGDLIDIDVTHGFRSMPMLGLLAALFLRRVRRGQMEHIWYGELGPGQGQGTVQDLVGLLSFADWLDALAVFDHTADYGVFARLTGPSGEWLESAAFFERTTNATQARQKLTTWANRPDRYPSNDPAVNLFRDTLDQRLSWRSATNRADWEAKLASSALEVGDYLRAAIFGLESTVTREVLAVGRSPEDFAAREEAGKLARSHYPGVRELAGIRNALAHGTRDRKLARTLDSPENLHGALQKLLAQVLDN